MEKDEKVKGKEINKKTEVKEEEEEREKSYQVVWVGHLKQQLVLQVGPSDPLLTAALCRSLTRQS